MGRVARRGMLLLRDLMERLRQLVGATKLSGAVAQWRSGAVRVVKCLARELRPKPRANSDVWLARKLMIVE